MLTLDLRITCKQQSYLLFKHQATGQRNGLFWGQLVKHTAKHELGAKQLIARADLARYSTLDINDVLCCGVAQPEGSQDTLCKPQLLCREHNILLKGTF